MSIKQHLEIRTIKITSQNLQGLERKTPHDGREFKNRRERKQRLRSLPENSDLEGLELNKKMLHEWTHDIDKLWTIQISNSCEGSSQL